MPELIRLYILHVAIGFAIAAVMVAGLLWFNVANLWHLVSTSDVGLLAVGLLWVSNGVVFAGVQFAIAVMGLAEDEDKGPKGGLRLPIRNTDPQPLPAPVAGLRKGQKWREPRQPWA